MFKKKITALMLAGSILLNFSVTVLLADSDGEADIILAHPISIYPGSDQEFSTDQTTRLTKDGFEEVRTYYEANKDSSDILEPFQQDNENGMHVVFHQVIKGKEQTLVEVTFTSQLENTDFHDALGELQAQVAMGRHSADEYQALSTKYKDIHRAYFRQVDDGDGGTVDEGKMIYRKAYNEAHPKKQSTGSVSEQAAGKAKGQDLRKQMQAMKAKGDLAGIMQLAQQANRSPGQTSEGAAALSAMNQDTWDLWVNCLEDMNQVAYWTRLQYHGNAIGQ